MWLSIVRQCFCHSRSSARDLSTTNQFLIVSAGVTRHRLHATGCRNIPVYSRTYGQYNQQLIPMIAYYAQPRKWWKRRLSWSSRWRHQDVRLLQASQHLYQDLHETLCPMCDKWLLTCKSKSGLPHVAAIFSTEAKHLWSGPYRVRIGTLPCQCREQQVIGLIYSVLDCRLRQVLGGRSGATRPKCFIRITEQRRFRAYAIDSWNYLWFNTIICVVSFPALSVHGTEFRGNCFVICYVRLKLKLCLESSASQRPIVSKSPLGDVLLIECLHQAVG